MSRQVFPIFDPINLNVLLYKDRHLVHRQGDWHKAIQANIIKPNLKGTFDILVQKRSRVVDIAKGKYDQSLATHMIKVDSLNEINSLKRGLYSELGINKFTYKKIDAHFRIIKKYKDQVGRINKEILFLYTVLVGKSQIILPRSRKVSEISWMEWNQFMIFFNNNKNNFTKTSQFYFSTPEIIREIEEAGSVMIGGGSLLKRTDNNLQKNCFLHLSGYETRHTQVISLNDLAVAKVFFEIP